MIYKLQRKFILICTVSVLLVVGMVFGVLMILNISSMNRNMDTLADRVSEGGGRFPSPFEEVPPPEKKPPMNGQGFDFITPETPFATRHFTVIFDAAGEVSRINTDSIYAITAEQAAEYATDALEKGGTRGWISSYRYKVFSTETGRGVVFVDGSMSLSVLAQSMTIAGSVLLGCAALVLVLIFLLSKKAVKPISESYEKQKQFVTDASHELKTPLTLILANLDIAETELGKNEWLGSGFSKSPSAWRFCRCRWRLPAPPSRRCGRRRIHFPKAALRKQDCNLPCGEIQWFPPGLPPGAAEFPADGSPRRGL